MSFTNFDASRVKATASRRCSGATRWCRGAVWALAVMASGCVTYRVDPPRFAGPWPPSEGGPRPAVRLTVSAGAIVDGAPRDVGPILDLWGAETERAYRESALFSDVALRPRRADVDVDVEIHAEVQQSVWLAVLSYLTFTVVPNVITTDLVMITRASDAEGQPLGTVEVRGRSRTIWQLLLFPFSPSHEPRQVTPGIVYDLDRQSIAELHSRGVF